MLRPFSVINRGQVIPLVLATGLGLGCRRELILGTVAMESRDAAAVNAPDGGDDARVDVAIGPDDAPGAVPDAPGAVPDAVAAGRVAVKFCNLWYNHPMTLEIGPQPVRLAADWGTCAPPLGEPCPTIPGGQVEMVLRRDVNSTSGVLKADMVLDRQYIVALEPRFPLPLIEGLVAYLLPVGASCSAVESRLPDPDPGAPDGGTGADGR
jgi:hypothetical protein